jgi:hypothetical protein
LRQREVHTNTQLTHTHTNNNNNNNNNNTHSLTHTHTRARTHIATDKTKCDDSTWFSVFYKDGEPFKNYPESRAAAHTKRKKGSAPSAPAVRVDPNKVPLAKAMGFHLRLQGLEQQLASLHSDDPSVSLVGRLLNSYRGLEQIAVSSLVRDRIKSLSAWRDRLTGLFVVCVCVLFCCLILVLFVSASVSSSVN